MSQWFYASGGQQAGPVSFDELRQLVAEGKVAKEDLVWNQGMKDWLPASTVPDLVAGVPSFPGPPSNPPVTADPANPYSTPSSSWGPGEIVQAAPALDEIEPGSEPIDVMGCIKRGIDLTKRHFVVLLLTGLIYIGISFGLEMVLGGVQAVTGQGGQVMVPDPDQPGSALFARQAVTPVSVISQIISQVVSLFLLLGWTRITLNLASGKEAEVGQLFSQGGKLLTMVGASILYYLGVVVGLVLLIVPGVYFALRFGQYTMAIVDRDLGVMDALRYSSRITKNNRLNLFGLGLMSFAIALAGFLALCVGLFFALPVIYLSWAVAYRWMQYGHRAALDHPGTTKPMLS